MAASHRAIYGRFPLAAGVGAGQIPHNNIFCPAGTGRAPQQREVFMKRALYSGVAAIAFTAFLVAAPLRLSAQPNVAIDADDIGGVVIGPNGPEAGVWVIAETRDLPTRYAKMVVTD